MTRKREELALYEALYSGLPAGTAEEFGDRQTRATKLSERLAANGWYLTDESPADHDRRFVLEDKLALAEDQIALLEGKLAGEGYHGSFVPWVRTSEPGG